MSTISVVIPTVTGREDYYEKCVHAYQHNSVFPLEIITVKDEPWVGRAWNKGADVATGEYLHFTADDLTPRMGWDAAAVLSIRAGECPAAYVYDYGNQLDARTVANQALVEGSVSPMSTVPFMLRSEWEKIGPCIDCHYYTDDWLALRAREEAGRVITTRSAFAFDHYWAMTARGAGSSVSGRLMSDKEIYLAACAEHGYEPVKEPVY